MAHEVKLMGGRSIACLNARDRNVLGFRRDLLTAAAYGVDEFLFVYGDRPRRGLGPTTSPSGDDRRSPPFRRPSGRLRRPDRCGLGSPAPSGLEQEADFLLAQISFSARDLLEWRASIDFSGPVFAGVMVVPGPTMARKLSADIPELAVPEPIIELLDRDGKAGVKIACDLIDEIRESQVFDGIHLIPVAAYREMAARLEQRP